MGVSLTINLMMIAALVDSILQTFSRQMLISLHIITVDDDNVHHVPGWISSLQILGLIASVLGLFLVHPEQRFLFWVHMSLIVGARMMINMKFVSAFAFRMYNICLLVVIFTILVKGFMLHIDYIVNLI